MSELPILTELRTDLSDAFREAESPPRLVRRPRRRWLALSAGGLLAAVAAGLVLSFTSGVQEHRLTPAPATAAAAVLTRAAAIVQDHEVPFPGPEEFFYVHSLDTNLSVNITTGASRSITVDRRLWASPTRASRLEVRPSHGTPTDIGHVAYFIGNEQLTRTQLLAYPTDPDKILARLRAGYQDGQGSGLDAELFTQIADALREQPAPAALLAGFYRALARIPGVEFLGDTRDRAGRHGLAVARTAQGTRQELILDRDTGELLGEREVLLDPDAAGLKRRAGSTITDSAYLERRVTAQAG